MQMPSPPQLAALGPVLCLYRPRRGGELDGWSASVRATAQCDIDSECLRECICFYDRAGNCCWRLFLLPDSDFLAWDRLVASLPLQQEHAPAGGVSQRLWSRLAQTLGGEAWQPSLLRFHLPHPEPGFGNTGGNVLAATMTPVSALGVATARRLARAEGLDATVLGDDCCCQRAGTTSYSATLADPGHYQSIRLRPGETTQ